ncbi:MAG TPA: endolytic transglycosylase MltG [Candidatus Corynebacterium gallistercoris]|uniref:Endolytic murein transglycosylase n=1 Tax=Candidatus Corynebacterium gallistercoris TaxID=2838530 RepID=A0A9D1S1D8_9CORY|nr:endolytic transglycosylase MltG [Candidatus Corynebacterium gallistercoris]
MNNFTQSKVRRRRQRAGALAIALVVLLVGVTGYVWYQRDVAGVRDFEGTGNGTIVMVRVDPGDSVDSLATELVDKGVVGSRRALMSQAEVTEPNLQAGYYTLQERMSAQAALEHLSSEEYRRGVVDIPNGLTLDDVTVVQGDTRKGIYTLISEQTCLDENSCFSPEELRAAVSETSNEDLGVPEWALQPVDARGDDPKRIEGLISPGVHLFDPTSEPKEIIRTLLTTSKGEYEKTGLISSAERVGLTPYELLTAASLVEREAPEGDFDKVARVILNRLEIGQKLEFDSTVNYSIDEVEVATTTADRQRETPWNTYAKEGLPATPIASPGLQSLHAVENPAEGDWLYFVTVDKDGRTVFNKEFADHEAAIAESIQNGVLDSNR